MPFTVEQFLGVFEKYNLAVFPMQIVAYVLGIVAIYLVFRNRGGRVVPAILSFMWLWNGVVYHGIFFSAINKPALGFAAIFVVQGLLFVWAGVFRKRLSFERPGTNLFTVVAVMDIGYALVVYPALGMFLGHTFPRAPMFGIAPCPTTIFTFGILLLATPRSPRYLLFIPLAWSLIGFGAALSLGVTEDVGLLVAGVVGCALIVAKGWAASRTAGEAGRAVAV
jgi:hypothetical protein